MTTQQNSFYVQSLSKQSHWNEKSYLCIEVENIRDWMVNLLIEFLAQDGRKFGIRCGIFPHWPTLVTFPLAICTGDILFPKRTPGRFKAVSYGEPIYLSSVQEIRVFPPKGGEEDLLISKIYVQNEAPSHFPLPDRPLVDKLHQWTHREWPGKAHSLDELITHFQKELKLKPSCYPAIWSKYGGWKERQLEPKGYFYTYHDGSRWWLVDPDGYPFWSIGIDCVRPSIDVNVTGIEQVFEEPLPSSTESPQLWKSRNGEKIFDALQHNLAKVLGKNWKQKWLKITRNRLIRCRFNTIGNWSDPDIQTYAKIPYVFTMTDFPTTPTKIFRDLPDVFDPIYERESERFAQQLVVIQNNPYVIGYFMTNEPGWAFVPHFDIGAYLLRFPKPSYTWDAFIQFLKQHCPTIESLNQSWGTSLHSFDQLFQGLDPSLYPESKHLTSQFTVTVVKRYVSLPALACRRVAPHHLNLGLRWAWIHSDYQLAGGEYLDAFSINCYQLKPDANHICQLSQKTGKPIMIGEFHIGSLDRGLPSGGIRNTPTLEESIDAYRYYVENAVVIPELIGVHYFQWNDQHVMGRFDGENMQIGLNDVTGRIYPEWQKRLPFIHRRLYLLAQRQDSPYSLPPNVVPQGTLCW